MPWGKCPTSGVIPLQAYPASKFSEKDELVTGVIVQRLLWTPHAAFTEFWPEGRDQPVILKVPTVLSSYLRWNETIFLKKVQCVWGCSFALVTPEKSMRDLPSTREWNWWRVLDHHIACVNRRLRKMTSRKDGCGNSAVSGARCYSRCF